MKVKYIESDAVISDCGKYRYLLRRIWNHQKPRALIVMLKPSTADAQTDDPTIRSCHRLLAELCFGGFEVVNLFAYRATNPKELSNFGIFNIVGPENDTFIKAAARRCNVIICAWGGHPEVLYRGIHVCKMLRVLSYGALVLYCFGMNKGGSPKHPLYVKSGTKLEVF